MRIFDTQVQELKYKVLMELAWQTWKGNDAFMVFNEIANEIVKKGEPPMSCCIYKDRAIVAERIRLALGGDKKNPNVIQDALHTGVRMHADRERSPLMTNRWHT